MFWFVSERSRVDKTKTSVEKSTSKTRAGGGITMMSPDSTSQNTLGASYVRPDGACAKKRKKKRRKKASRVRAKKAGAARWNATTRGGSASSQEDSVVAELDCLSPKETDTMDLSDEDFKPEARVLSRKDILDLYDEDFKVKAKLPDMKDVYDTKVDVVKLKSQQMGTDNRLQGRHGAKDVDVSDEGINKNGKKGDLVKLKSQPMRAENKLQGGRGAKDVDISDEGINDCYVADTVNISKRETTQMITKTMQDEKKTTSRSVIEKVKTQPKLKETDRKKPQRGRKKSHDGAAPSIENKGRKSEDPPSNRKATEEDIYCFDDDEVDACLEDDTVIQIDVSGGRDRNRHNFGSQISDYDAESQDANLIHRDEIAEGVESQESAAYSQDVNEIERSIPFKRAEKEPKTLQDPKRTKKTTQPHVTEKVDYPIGFEDFAKTGVRSRKHLADRSIDRHDKKRNKQGTMEALCKQARIRRSPDNSLPAYDMFGSQVKQPKFFKSRHKERMGNVEKIVDSSDDVYSFEPTNVDKKRHTTSKKADRSGDDSVTEDELICGSELPSKLTKSGAENSFHKHANKPSKLPPKDKSKKGAKHSDATRAEQRESKYESTREDKPKHKMKCLSTLRERIQTSVLYDFEDAVATNFGFDDDDEDGEQVSRSVRITPTEDPKQIGNSECAAKENAKKTVNSEYVAKENAKKTGNSEYVAKENAKKKDNSEYAAKENVTCVEGKMRRKAKEDSKAAKNSSLKVG